MSQKLPADDFKWKNNMLKFTDDSNGGYIPEVDYKYLKNFHD